MPSKELRDSLVDMYRGKELLLHMYRDNPKVNEELRQRLPSPATQQLSSPDRSGSHLSLDQTDPPRGPQHLPELPSSCSPSPLSHRSSVSPVSRLLHWRSVSPLSPLSSRPPGGARPMELDLSPSRGPSPQAESCGDSPDRGGASRSTGSPALTRHLVSPDDSSHREVMFGPITASDRLQIFDRDKNMSFLLKELDNLRGMNQKLQEELVQKEKELQRREVEEELREEQREARGWERPAAVLEEMLAAQKDRDQALMSRLLLANEERDEALLRARQVQQAAEVEHIPLEDPDVDVDELLRCVCDADSVQEVERFGSVLVQHLQLAKQRRNDITAQEMKAVMDERDCSVAKHLDSPRTYARILFVDFSSAFKTIIPSLHDKLSQLHVPDSTCKWITDFLSDRKQHVKLGKHVSASRSISTSSSQGCVLSPLLFSLYTNSCTSSHLSVKLLRFADDTTPLGGRLTIW
ncbi:mirror-image polydactyly gene 1 protein isoform X8 [Cyclopterus lumpus]|uniref:mirror-image polydactyly gene 1 protein isoform X8 n=1 Tax=Cyclopterus lumpus TaxID=8103 RepID=UPI00148616E7|nr:mirror-image polydactyly gene 1 protein isoform X8 [Cyclopterus lumpus]